MTFFYSVLHLLVDGVCALAMFGSFLGREDGYFYILVYNFCAFALQMPFGVVLDSLQERERGWRDFACLMAGTGVLCTLAGAVTHPAVLGIGNALFHVGGGVGVIREDRARGWRGRGLGVFVAPGALGLFLGTQIAGTGTGLAWTGGIGILMALLCLAAWRCGRRGAARTEAPGTGQNRRTAEVPETIGNEAADGRPTDAKMRETAANAAVDGGLTGAKLPGPVLENLMGNESAETADSRKRLPGRGPGQSGIIVAVCCLAVVALRSYVGMAVALPWKSGMLAGVLAVLAVVGGKMAGGFAGAAHGMRRTAIVSLGLAAVCYLGCAAMPLGLAALFLFNMTMPVTLYWLVCSMPGRPGFAFGFLTFALFLGFLPVYFGLAVGNGNVLGCGGSILSLLLLAAGMGRREYVGKYFLDMFGFSLALTMVVELAVAFLFRRCWAGKSAVESAAAGNGTRLARKGRLPEDVLFARPGRVLALVMLVNLLTNPLAVLLCWLGKVNLPFFLAWPVQLVVEAGAVAVEAYVYRSFSGKSGWRIGHPMALAVTTNVCSWLLGILAMAVKRQTWFHMLTLWLELLRQ